MGENAVRKVVNPTMRLACADDLAQVLTLYQHLHQSEDSSEIAQRIEIVWQEMLKDSRLYCFVAELDSILVGTCILDIVPNLTRGARPFGVLQNVVSHQDYRGQGIGKQLNLHALKFAWAENCYQVLVQTGRPEVVGFYQGLGFRLDKIGLVAKPEWSGTSVAS